MQKFLLQSKYYLVVIPFLLVLLLFSGCGGMQIAALEKGQAEDIEKNKEIALAVGQRTFDVSQTRLMKAFITAFSDKNLAVMNLDNSLGFMVAEGAEFLDPAKIKEIGKTRIDRLNKHSFPGAFVYVAGNYVLRITVNLFKKGENRTLAKLGFTSVTKSNAPNVFNGVPFEFLPHYYKEMWAALEQSLFVQREIIE